ncbi:alpha/beta hydrolase [Knoellia sp. LjRoot47]|uniref:alpha/beta hydrolase n=1 Tax=Knoellia sp. LjRoot47 TaxID=3342330 RepID=UPI003ED04912
MPLTWSDITAWKHEPLATAERELRTTRRDLLDLADELATMGLPKNWTGDAAETSGTRLATVADDLRDVVAEVSAAYTAVCDAADGVLGVVGAVDQAQEYARLSSLTISASGVVTTNELLVCRADDDEEDVEARRARQAQVDECVTRISEALRKAADVDADLSAVLTSIELNRIDGGKGTLAQASAIGEVKGDLSVLEPPRGGSPTQNAAWWATLSPDERALVIAEHPGWIGNLDGVDATSRDLANRNLLDTRRTHVTTRLAELEAGFIDEDGNFDYVYYQDHVDEYNDLMEEKGAIATLDEMLARPGEHQLIGVDFTTPRTQAIVANGNVDTADHVAVFTPGLTSTVEGMGGYDSSMAQLRARTEDELFRRGESGTVATVTWLDYQAPQWGTTFAGDSVALSGSAEDGGRDLAAYFTGLNASRLDDPDLTALGHSYGSTTTGYSLQHEGTGVDRAVFFGSPGLGTSDLDDLHLPEGNAYYAEAKWDPVGDLGRFGTDPTGLDGMNHLETGDGESADGRSWNGVEGHSDYLQDGSTSQYSMAQVVGGHPDDVIEGKNVGFWTDPLDAQPWWPGFLK